MEFTAFPVLPPPADKLHAASGAFSALNRRFMKIAFITSCLEPGCDGVGDYTALLAEETARQGHEVKLIALNDPFIKEAVEAGKIHRFAEATPWAEREAAAAAVIERFNPELVSLQFVCYGYAARGILGPVRHVLERLVRGRRLQVFFHELWIGEEANAPLKDRLAGWLQCRDILRLLRNLNPARVETSNPSYRRRLENRGVQTGVLPLFGSLPLPPDSRSQSRDRTILAMFGTLHPVWPAEPLFTYLRRWSKPVELIHAGRIGAGAALWEELNAKYGEFFTFRRLGELPPEAIAQFFAQADFGVATTPWAIIGKSASVAAMIDCGLPVIVNRDDIRYPGAPPLPDSVDAADADGYHPLLIKMDANLAARMTAATKQPPRLRLPEITARFLSGWE